MENTIINKTSIYILLCVLLTCSCNKILDEKSNQALAVPNSISDYQALLDNNPVMNNNSATWDEASTDNLYLPKTAYDNQSPLSQDAYIWKHVIYNGPYNDWASLYNVVYLANLSLKGIVQIKPNKTNLSDWNNVKGSALFFRAQSFLHAAYIFCKAYDSVSAENDYGIVLRLSSDFNQKSRRVNLQASYDQIIKDLKEAIKVLPEFAVTPYRPSKPAAYALLARTYLSMRNYVEAGKYADSCLQIKNDLMDYNAVDLNSLRPFKQLNEEVIFHRIASTTSFAIINPNVTRVDSVLFQSYADEDLRKYAFFRSSNPGIAFKGTYNGNLSTCFFGIATDEVFLIRAECNARQYKIDKAMDDLNKLLKSRWKSGEFESLIVQDPKEALKLILTERRKELLYRGLRWMDIKRLNKEGANIVLQRIAGGKIFELSPNDIRYELPLPADIIEITGIPQNNY